MQYKISKYQYLYIGGRYMRSGGSTYAKTEQDALNKFREHKRDFMESFSGCGIKVITDSSHIFKACYSDNNIYEITVTTCGDNDLFDSLKKDPFWEQFL